MTDMDPDTVTLDTTPVDTWVGVPLGGAWSDIIHSKFAYRTPAMTGDLTLLNGEVTAVKEDPRSGQPLAVVQVTMTNQDDAVLASGGAEVRLPTADLPRAEHPA